MIKPEKHVHGKQPGRNGNDGFKRAANPDFQGIWHW
jgi:hypothetical protein